LSFVSRERNFGPRSAAGRAVPRAWKSRLTYQKAMPNFVDSRTSFDSAQIHDHDTMA
jgi:hypothetical protein